MAPRPTDRTRFRREAERTFPHKVDIPVASYGQPWPFAEMLAWCAANIAAGAWAQHGFMDKHRRDDRGVPIDVTRWYFTDAADAEAFRQQWGDYGV
jgi:hypothetical protein